MSRKKFYNLIIFYFGFLYSSLAGQWIRINQLGYLPDDVKTAVWISKEKVSNDTIEYEIVNELTGEVVFSGRAFTENPGFSGFGAAARLDFTNLKNSGLYRINTEDGSSSVFRVGNRVYEGAADLPLYYMRQQRCGDNPFLDDSCHRYDGRIIYHPERTGEKVDVRGGWHDASDYLQYVTTSANAVFQMLFAYEHFPQVFGDRFDASGRPGANGIPDILDEARWGLEWLVRMNPDTLTYFNQLADDRDHTQFKLPADDTADYGWGPGKERPVYFCTGEKQGLFQHLNRTTGMASTAGKFSSAFSLGARLLASYDPNFSKMLEQKASAAYRTGAARPGVCQTAPCRSPYFYEEDNWTDDMELAATQLYRRTNRADYLRQAIGYGRMEPVTPWMGADSARHYQWYPFVNLGHYYIASAGNCREREEFIRNLRSGLQRIAERGGTNVFRNGIPFIWCSNNLTVAALTQCRLYEELTGDPAFAEMEASLRDWLFGCNPWGKCMITALPESGDYPAYPHSALYKLAGHRLDGGLVDGPVYASIYNNLKGLYLSHEDSYAPFQSEVVYHDDESDYSTNEPTMDGTASLCYYLASRQSAGKKAGPARGQKVHGGIIRGDTTRRALTLVFTGHEFADGGEMLLKTLDKYHIQAAFFLTGQFYRLHGDLARRLQQAGHYLGPHSENHLLYVSWENRDSTLVSREKFITDLTDNYRTMRKAGIKPSEPFYFLPAFEWYNEDISRWTGECGVQLICFTPGTSSNADYTTPDMPSYRTSAEIENRILTWEKEHSLNGFLLLSHIGTDSSRTDKFYDRLESLIRKLRQKGYRFVSLPELLNK